MGKENVDVCDMCDTVIGSPRDGLVFSGENIGISWAGRGSPAEDPFENNGSHAPMNGRVGLTVCIDCINKVLGNDKLHY